MNVIWPAAISRAECWEAGTMAETCDAWKTIDAHGLQYHLRQWHEQKRSTIAFADFIAPHVRGSLIDLACGAGAPTSYLARRHPQARVTGLDYSEELIGIANSVLEKDPIPNLAFEVDDWNDLRPRTVDGVVSLQSISWLPDFKVPLGNIIKNLSPNWIALSSLFYNGDISCQIQVTEHVRNRTSFYNVYAIPEVARFAGEHGYSLESVPFTIDIDLPRPDNPDLMGTYTIPSVDGRIQVSGPLLMNWRFVLLRR
jgi:SAM-dependent methyltransferase